MRGREAEDNTLHGEGEEGRGGEGQEGEEEEVAGAPCAPWPPRRGRPRLHVAIPGSVLSTEHTLRDKTVKAGFIARALAVYRVDRVIVFDDPDTDPADSRLLHALLSYTATPPHLRRRLQPIRPHLRYAGLLPPLQTPNHLPPQEPRPGAIIDGLVETVNGAGRCRVWLGQAGHAILEPCKAKPGSVVTVKITRPGTPARARPATWGDTYTGFTVQRTPSLATLIHNHRQRGFLVIATSRLGQCLHENPPPLKGKPGLLVAFGGPKRGLLQYTPKSLYDAIYNTIPSQGTRTVRTEEALHATLALINTLRTANPPGR